MKNTKLADEREPSASGEQRDTSGLLPSILGRPVRPGTTASLPGEAVVGELVAVTERALYVRHPGQPGAGAVAARSTVDLCADHVGQKVVLLFERDLADPIIIGVLRDPLAAQPGVRPVRVELVADGDCLTVCAKEQLVLSCGKARITLTQAGKVLVEGTYVSTRASGVNRIRGGSVQIN